MGCRFEFRCYHRSFQPPLTTAHGTWAVRDGIIVRFSHESGAVGFGEIAPLDWFGSETYEQAIAYCRQWASVLSTNGEFDETFAGLDNLPACRFGLESGWQQLLNQLSSTNNSAGPGQEKVGGARPTVDGSSGETSSDCVSSELGLETAKVGGAHPTVEAGYRGKESVALCGLLPTGEAAIQACKTLGGYCTFKWKIGVAPLQTELSWAEQLVAALPAGATLRLDANGGLTPAEADTWLNFCDEAGIEFLEQPLPPEQFEEMLWLGDRHSTPLALDESVATLPQLKVCHAQGWRGIFVVKAAILGSPASLRGFCQAHPVDLVFSTVFETGIGRRAALDLAAELNHPNRAVGFGTRHWFADDLDTADCEAIWRRLPAS